MSGEISTVILDARIKNTEKNITRLHTALEQTTQTITNLQLQIRRLETTVAQVQQELAIVKQTSAFLVGRGTGPSVVAPTNES